MDKEPIILMMVDIGQVNGKMTFKMDLVPINLRESL